MVNAVNLLRRAVKASEELLRQRRSGDAEWSSVLRGSALTPIGGVGVEYCLSVLIGLRRLAESGSATSRPSGTACLRVHSSLVSFRRSPVPDRCPPISGSGLPATRRLISSSGSSADRRPPISSPGVSATRDGLVSGPVLFSARSRRSASAATVLRRADRRRRSATAAS